MEAHWYGQQRKVCEGAAREALFRIKNPTAAAAAARKKGGEGGGGDGRGNAAAATRGAGPPSGAAAGAVGWSAAGVGRRLGGEAAAEDDEFRDLIDDGDEEEEEEGDVEMEDAVADDANKARLVDLTKENNEDGDDDDEDRYLTPDESRRVLAPLLRLRQACNHPQAGTHGVRGLAKGRSGAVAGGGGAGHIGAGGIHSGVIMTMPQIHAVLIERQRTEAEEAQRLVAFTLNASAGVACCRGNFAEAVGHYREVLRLEAAGAADGLGLRLDSLQRLHALHNLQLALDAAAAAAAGANDPPLAPAATGNAAAAAAGAAAAARADTAAMFGSASAKGGEGGERGGDPSQQRQRQQQQQPSAVVGVSRSLRDASLAADADTERQKYIVQRAGGCGAAASELKKSSAAVEDARRRCGARGRGPAGCTWWSGVIDDAVATSADRGRGLLERVLDNQLNGGYWQGREVAFTDLAGLRFQLESELQKMGEERGKFLDRMSHLSRVTAAAAPEDVNAAGRCHECSWESAKNSLDAADGGHVLGPRNQTLQSQRQKNLAAQMRAASGGHILCQHCAAGALCMRYEDVIFGVQKSEHRGMTTDVGSGRSAPSSAEVVLKFLSTRLPKSGLAAAAAAEAAAAHLEALEEMRREFTRAMILQKHQRDELQAQDELVMATTRIRVRLAHEVALGGLPDPVPEHLRASVVHDWELDDMEEGYVADRGAYEADLRRAASQVKFLERLRHEDGDGNVNGGDAGGEAGGAGDGDGGGTGEGGAAGSGKAGLGAGAAESAAASSSKAAAFECPVCHEEVNKSAAAAELAVLPCGHRLCVSCTDTLVSRAPPPAPRQPRCFKCPTCRTRTPADEINYVSAGASRVRVERWPAPPASSSTLTSTAAAAAAADSAARRNATAMDAQLGTEEEQLAGEASLVVKGSWGTKVEAVVRRIMWLLDETRPGGDAVVKALVFSEWEDALRVVAAALHANGVLAEHPLGGGQKLRDAIERFKGRGGGGGGGGAAAVSSAIPAAAAAAAAATVTAVEGPPDAAPEKQHLHNHQHQHQHQRRPRHPPAAAAASTPLSPPPPRVLLMPLRRGANGLNLTEAQHVILLEPVLDPGAEAQAGPDRPSFTRTYIARLETRPD